MACGISPPFAGLIAFHFVLQLCAIIVFGVIADNGEVQGFSIFNNNHDARRLGIAIGVLAFFAASAVLALGFVSVTSSIFSQQQRLIKMAIFGVDVFL